MTKPALSAVLLAAMLGAADTSFAPSQGVPYSFRNGGTPTGAAAAKRAAKKRRNIRRRSRHD